MPPISWKAGTRNKPTEGIKSPMSLITYPDGDYATTEQPQQRLEIATTTTREQDHYSNRLDYLVRLGHCFTLLTNH